MGRIYVNENKILLNEIIEIYKPEKYDWLSYQITKNNILRNKRGIFRKLCKKILHY